MAKRHAADRVILDRTKPYRYAVHCEVCAKRVGLAEWILGGDVKVTVKPHCWVKDIHDDLLFIMIDKSAFVLRSFKLGVQESRKTPRG